MSAVVASAVGAGVVAPSAIWTHDLGVRLGGAPVLRSVGLAVDAGEWLSVIGPNGAGKSTLLRAIAGLQSATGQVRLFGMAVGSLPRRARAQLVALVPQQPTMPPGMTVRDYVLLGRTPYLPYLGRESATDWSVVIEVLNQLDMYALADRSLETLSGGEQQRAVLGRALAQGARLLLLDEPTAALDVGHQQEVLDLIDRLRVERGLTVLASMHDLSAAGEYADRLALLDAGRVAAIGAPQEVLTEELISKHYRARVRVLAGDRGPLVVAVR